MNLNNLNSGKKVITKMLEQRGLKRELQKNIPLRKPSNTPPTKKS